MEETANRSEYDQPPGSPAHRLRNPSEKPTTTPMAVRDPFRNVESIRGTCDKVSVGLDVSSAMSEPRTVKQF